MAAKEPFFHRGEAFIQDKIGVKAQMAHFAPRVITPELPEQHQRFYEQLAYLFVGHVDEQGNPWVSILYSQPGFIKATSCQQLNISADTTLGDPLSRSLKKGAHIGILGIDLASRRRNRLSGKINKLAAGSFDVTVDQAFGNCSKYIQSRSMRFTHNKALVPRVDSFTQLDIKTQQFIASADTFFVASHNLKGSKEKNEGVDVSHRGGVPGFIHVKDNTLTIPDYSGNQHFNTLGNFIEQPKAGLLFIDFNTHSVLMVTGSVNIIWNVENAERFLNAQRLWGFTLEKGMWLHNVLPMSWSFKSYSPFNKVLQESRNTNKDSVEKNYPKSARVHFTQSDIQEEWKDSKGTLLEFAENKGLTPKFGCRQGACGLCKVKLKSGKVRYDAQPNMALEEDDILICCAKPASTSVEVIL